MAGLHPGKDSWGGEFYESKGSDDIKNCVHKHDFYRSLGAYSLKNFYILDSEIAFGT